MNVRQLVGKPKVAKDMIYPAHAEHPKQQAPQQQQQQPVQQGGAQPTPPTSEPSAGYHEFTRGFVSHRQSALHLGGNAARGSEQFGRHVVPRVNATPTGDGMTPGEQTGGNSPT